MIVCILDGTVPTFMAFDSCISRLCRFWLSGAYSTSFLIVGHHQVLSCDQYDCCVALASRFIRCRRWALQICAIRPRKIAPHNPVMESHKTYVVKSSTFRFTPASPDIYPLAGEAELVL